VPRPNDWQRIFYFAGSLLHVLFTQTDPHRSLLFWQAAMAVLVVAVFLHESKDFVHRCLQSARHCAVCEGLSAAGNSNPNVSKNKAVLSFNRRLLIEMGISTS
jgi:hypothetical protein